jgi:hypothetical protein
VKAAFSTKQTFAYPESGQVGVPDLFIFSSILTNCFSPFNLLLIDKYPHSTGATGSSAAKSCTKLLHKGIK